MKEQHKSWQEISPSHKALVALGAAAQFSLLGAALWDLGRRPAAQVRGPKALWVGVSFVNFLGPLAYFICGRKRA